MALFFSFCRIFLLDRSSGLFLVGIVVAMGLSISVVLSAIGIMDGFVVALKSGLQRSNGDIIVQSKDHFFHKLDDSLLQEYRATSLLQTEAFVIQEGFSRGVILKGIDEESFQKVTGLSVDFTGGDVVLGKELAQQLGPQKQGPVVVALPHGNEEIMGAPGLMKFRYASWVDHGIYRPNQRFVYIKKGLLQRAMGRPNKNNAAYLALKNQGDIEKQAQSLQMELGPSYTVESFWQQQGLLLKAVEVEKFMIGQILQLIVIVSIFNVLAFIIFVKEKKVQELFLLQALGLGRRAMARSIFLFTGTLWAMASLTSLGFVALFGSFLKNTSFFDLPGEIYSLVKLKISLDFLDYLLVFSLSGLWLFILVAIGLAKLRRKSMITGLRREFV